MDQFIRAILGAMAIQTLDSNQVHAHINDACWDILDSLVPFEPTNLEEYVF
jgi:hypothetical protein